MTMTMRDMENLVQRLSGRIETLERKNAMLSANRAQRRQSSNARIDLNLNQSGHGFAAGAAVYWAGSAWAKAPAATILDTDQLAIVESVTDVNHAVLVLWGKAKFTSLTAYADYYLTGTGATTTAPGSAQNRVVMTAISATVGLVNPGKTLPGILDMGNTNKVQILAADFIGTGKTVKLREIDVCETGVAKKMLVLCSATY